MKSQAASFKNTEFNVQDFPLVHIAAIHKAYNVTLANEFRSFEVTPQMWRILVTLQSKNGYSIGHLSDVTLIEQSHLSRLIDTMEQDKLVDRRSQSRDKRIKLVQITRKGRSLFEEMLPIAMSQYDKILTGFSRDEIDSLMGFLGRIRRNLGSNS